jgi:hypothetical protein
MFTIAAVAAFVTVGCSGDETLEAPEKKAISFDNAFVDKRTRTNAEDPSTTTDNISKFTVYGYQGTNLLFNGQEVSNSGGTWSYSPVKYWISGETYNFVALANVTGATTSINSDTKTITTKISDFTNDGGADPLVSAQQTVTASTTTMGSAVSFSFKHLLAKVKFTFENAFAATDDVTLQIKNVTITNAYKKGNIDVSGTDPTISWTSQSDPTASLVFGNTGTIAPTSKDEAANAKLLIPSASTKEYTITFDVDIIAKVDDSTTLVTKTYNKTVKVTNQALDGGKSYNFQAKLDATNIGGSNTNGIDDGELKPIKFSINEVLDWTSGGDVTVMAPAN